MKYRYIVADPPWAYNTWRTPEGLPHRRQRSRGMATAVYPKGVMTTERIKQIPVADLCEPDAALLLWVTMPLLLDAEKVAAAWGFNHYSTCGFVWIKTNPSVREGSILHPDRDFKEGTGYWTQANAELALLFTRGKNPPSRAATGVKETIVSPVREHSEKPLESYRRFETLMGFGNPTDYPGNYLDIFARRYRRGWTALGVELDGLDIFESVAQLAALDEKELGFVPKGVRESLTDCCVVEDWQQMLRPQGNMLTGQMRMAI